MPSILLFFIHYYNRVTILADHQSQAKIVLDLSSGKMGKKPNEKVERCQSPRDLKIAIAGKKKLTRKDLADWLFMSYGVSKGIKKSTIGALACLMLE